MAFDIQLGRDSSDKKLFGDKGFAFLGKGYVKMGQYTSLSNRILLDVVRSHIILVAGKRGSGKSYTLGVIAEEISSLPKEISQNIGSLIFDTMGIYWTMKFENEKDKELLFDWQLKAKNLPVKIFVPFGHYDSYLNKGILADRKFSLDVSEMNPEDWVITFGLDIINPIAVLIERTVTAMEESGDFTIEDIINSIEKDEKSSEDVKNAAVSFFEAAKTWGIFAEENSEATKIEELISGGTTSVLDLSVYNSIGAFNVRALVISIVSRKIFNQRMDARKKEEIDSVSRGFDYLSKIK